MSSERVTFEWERLRGNAMGETEASRPDTEEKRVARRLLSLMDVLVVD